jgi:hypothetical protein
MAWDFLVKLRRPRGVVEEQPADEAAVPAR